MKNFTAFIALVIITGTMSAKVVKFAVDMTGQTINPNGVHVTGDFQEAAGKGPDWDPGTVLLTKEGTTDIYSVYVKIPAFKKYEYRFVNGNQTYEAEFVPVESRVGYDFVDNRWLFVDSLANDTSFVGAIVFAANAPAGKTLVRYKVDLRLVGSIAPTGIHVGTSYQSTPYDASKMRLYSFVTGIYELINYVNAGSYSYIFYNGNNGTGSETVSGTCTTGGKRTVTISTDIELTQVCFGSCAACVGVGITEKTGNHSSIILYPNPGNGFFNLDGNAPENTITVTDITGAVVSQPVSNLSENRIYLGDLENGIYFVNIANSKGQIQTEKLILAK